MRTAIILGAIAIGTAIRAASGLESAMELGAIEGWSWVFMILLFLAMDVIDLCAKILKRGE